MEVRGEEGARLRFLRCEGPRKFASFFLHWGSEAKRSTLMHGFDENTSRNPIHCRSKYLIPLSQDSDFGISARSRLSRFCLLQVAAYIQQRGDVKAEPPNSEVKALFEGSGFYSFDPPTLFVGLVRNFTLSVSQDYLR